MELKQRVLRRIFYKTRGVELKLVKSLQFKDVFYIVQKADEIESIGIPKEWAEAILALNEPKDRIK